MFILKLGAEARNRLEEHLNEQSNQPTPINQKNLPKNQMYSYASKMESSILYNLLSSDDGSLSKTRSLLHPNYQINADQQMPPRSNTISYSEQRNDLVTLSPRPYSAPQSTSETASNIRKRKHSVTSEFEELKNMIYIKNCKINLAKLPDKVDSPTFSCSTDSFTEEPMDLSKSGDTVNYSSDSARIIAISWLMEMVEMINPNNEPSNRTLAELSLHVRLHLLQSTWHRLIVTYLFDHLMKTSNIHLDGITKFITSLGGISNQSVLSKKKLSKMYKSQLEELSNILYQMKKLNLDEKSMHFFRIGLFLTGNHDETNKKNLNLIEMFIHSKIGLNELNASIMRDTIDNVFKLNSVIMETFFYGHLDESVEKVIEQILNHS